MIKIIKAAMLMLALTLTTTGCGSGPKIVNVPTQNITKKITLKNMHDSIYRAGASRGWNMQKASDGILNATYAKRGFSVTCTIAYTSTTYKIDYKTSQGLKYDEKTQTIHRNYNSWIANLKKQIEMEITLL